MALIEVAVALPIVLVGIGLFLQMLTAGSGLHRTGQESWIASSAAQNTLEGVRNADTLDVSRLYTADPFEDPRGPGTAPGNRFTDYTVLPVLVRLRWDGDHGTREPRIRTVLSELR